MAQQLPSKAFLDLWRWCSSQPGHWQLLWPRNQTLRLLIWPTRKTWVSQRSFLKLNCQRVSTSTSQGCQFRRFDQMLALYFLMCTYLWSSLLSNEHIQRIFLSRFLFRQCNYSCGFCFHTAKTSFLLPIEVPDKNKQTWFSNTTYKLGDIYRWRYSFFFNPINVHFLWLKKFSNLHRPVLPPEMHFLEMWWLPKLITLIVQNSPTHP